MMSQMNSVFKNIIIKFNIDWDNAENREILTTAYEDQRGVNGNFLRSIGIYVEPLDLRVYKKYMKQKQKIKEWRRCTTNS